MQLTLKIDVNAFQFIYQIVIVKKIKLNKNMKKLKYILTGTILLMLFNPASSQFLVNNGVDVVIKPNTALVINGDYINQLDGNINCEGMINTTGNWTNNAISGNLLQGSTGQVIFKGTQEQTVGGSSQTWFPELAISEGPGQLKLESDISCSGNLNISEREFRLNGHKIHAGSYVLLGINGTLTADSGSVFEMSDNNIFQAIYSANVKFLGTKTSPAILKCSMGYYHFEILNGATLHAEHAIFENMGLEGLKIHGSIDPLHSLHNCTFQNGRPDGVLITFNNPDPVSINDARFPENTWGSNYNVTKLNDEGKVTFNEATGNFAGEWFENDPDNSVDWNNTQMMDELSLEEGWSGMSSWVVPGGEDVTIPFAPILENLLIVLTMDGMYYPAQNINTIGAWENHDAFMIKMDEAVEFSLLGEPETNNIVQLYQGWTLMPVVSPIPVNSDELFSGISWAMEIVKEVAGTKVFWPDMGIYTLDEIQPGKSYLIRCSDPTSLEFIPFPPEGWQKDNNIEQIAEIIVHHPWNKIVRSNLSHTIGFPEELSARFEEGDVIGAFTTDGSCAGVAGVQAGMPFSITAFADDQLTTMKEGFATGEILTFKKYSPDDQQETEFAVLFNQEFPDADGLFVPNGISVIKEILIGSAGVAQNIADKQLVIYPNPTTGKFTVSGLAEATQLKLTDARGTEVLSRQLDSKQSLELDLTEKLNGVYFIKVFFPDKVEIRKVVVN